jgi:ribosomal protein L37AE/L43A
MTGITEPTGYSHEDATFKKQEQEALAKIRSELDAKRRQTAASSAKAAHWMCCPKCGGQMVEKKFESIMIDECSACGGIYFDKGEIDVLLRAEKAGGGVFSRLFGR